MSQPLRSSQVSFINFQYLACCRHTVDPTIVWGTEVDAEELQAFIRNCNRTSDTVVSAAHVLVKAVADSLAQFPELNCRIVGGRIFRFRDVNVRIIHNDVTSSEVSIVTLPNADQLELAEISRILWQTQLSIAQGGHDTFDKTVLAKGPHWFRRAVSRTFWWLDRTFRLPRVNRIDRHLDSSVIVNYLGQAALPPMRAYKPSKFPDESSLLSVTLGRVEPAPVVRNGQVVVRPMAPLFIRGDHRITDAYRLGRFAGELRAALENIQTRQTQRTSSQAAPFRAA